MESKGLADVLCDFICFRRFSLFCETENSLCDICSDCGVKDFDCKQFYHANCEGRRTVDVTRLSLRSLVWGLDMSEPNVRMAPAHNPYHHIKQHTKLGNQMRRCLQKADVQERQCSYWPTIRAVLSAAVDSERAQDAGGDVSALG